MTNSYWDRIRSRDKAREELTKIRKITEQAQQEFEKEELERTRLEFLRRYTAFRDLTLNPTENGIKFLDENEKFPHLKLFEVVEISYDANQIILWFINTIGLIDKNGAFKKAFKYDEQYFICKQLHEIMYWKKGNVYGLSDDLKNEIALFLRRLSGEEYYGNNRLIMYNRDHDFYLLERIDRLLRCDYINDTELIDNMKEFAPKPTDTDYQRYEHERRIRQTLTAAYGDLIGTVKCEMLKSKVFQLLERLNVEL